MDDNEQNLTVASSSVIFEQPSESDVDMIVGVAKTMASSPAKKLRTSATFLAMQESVKEKLMKMKEQRAYRYQELQLPHRHICDMSAMYWGIEPNEVMEGVIDDSFHVELLQNLLDKGKTKCILYFYQDGPPYPVESGRSTATTKLTIPRIFVSNGVSLGMDGKAIAVYKINNVSLDLKNINDDVCFVQFDMTEKDSNFAAVAYDLLKDILTPLLALTKDWGDLPKTENGRMQKLDFEGDFAAFVTYLDRTKMDLSGVVTFTYDEKVLNQIDQGEKREKAFFDKVLIQQVETIVRVWHKLIERCLVQFRQLRREDEFVGPVFEIDYWRRQLARFTSLVEFLETEQCHIFIDFLDYIDNKEIMKIWKKHLDAVYDTRNECSDNVKYLYSMEQYWQPFYRLEIPELAYHIPPLLHAIRMVFTTSRYYNSTGNVTALLVKVSNQIIIKCRNYLNCNDTKTVWNQPKQEVLKKITMCLDLYLKYYQCFKRTRKLMEEAEEKPFECSEMFIFGKFETFKKRVEEIVFVLNTTIKYSILQSSTIDGIDDFANKFVNFHKKISTQKYDALNHRLPYFDADYKEFRQNVVDTEWELEEFVGASLSKFSDVDNVLRLLKRSSRFEHLRSCPKILNTSQYCRRIASIF